MRPGASRWKSWHLICWPCTFSLSYAPALSECACTCFPKCERLRGVRVERGVAEGSRGLTSGALTPVMRMWIMFLIKSVSSRGVGLGMDVPIIIVGVAPTRAPRERLGMCLNLNGPRQPKPGV